MGHPIMFKCPETGMRVQHWLTAEDRRAISVLARKLRERMQPWVLLNLLAFALSFFRQANDLTRSLRQYDDGFALSFESFLGFSVHGFDPLQGLRTPLCLRSSFAKTLRLWAGPVSSF